MKFINYILKIIPLVILWGIILSTFLVCFNYNELNKDSKIIVIFKTMDPISEFWQIVKMGIETAQKEFNIAVDIRGPWSEDDIDGQIQIIKTAIKEKPTAIILAASDYNMLVPISKEIVKNGIKLICIDSGLNSDLPKSFIATNNLEAGRKSAKAMIDLLEPLSNIVIISYVKGVDTAIDREKGVKEYLNQNSDYSIIGTYFCDNYQDRAYSITTKLLTERTDIDGIIALNESSTIGSGKAIKDLGLTGIIKLVGFDGQLEEIKLLEEGVIQATIVQKPFNMGYLGVKIAVQVIKGEKVSKFIDTGSKKITREDIYTIENQKLLFPIIE